MTPSAVRQDLVGLEVFSRDGMKLGKIKTIVGDGESAAEYLVVHPDGSPAGILATADLAAALQGAR